MSLSNGFWVDAAAERVAQPIYAMRCDTRPGIAMEPQRIEQLGPVGQGIVTGFLLLTSYYTMALGTGYAHNSTLWTALIAGLFVGTSILFVLSTVELINGRPESRSLLLMGALLLLLQILALAAITVAETL